MIYWGKKTDIQLSWSFSWITVKACHLCSNQLNVLDFFPSQEIREGKSFHLYLALCLALWPIRDRWRRHKHVIFDRRFNLTVIISKTGKAVWNADLESERMKWAQNIRSGDVLHASGWPRKIGVELTLVQMWRSMKEACQSLALQASCTYQPGLWSDHRAVVA